MAYLPNSEDREEGSRRLSHPCSAGQEFDKDLVHFAGCMLEIQRLRNPLALLGFRFGSRSKL